MIYSTRSKAQVYSVRCALGDEGAVSPGVPSCLRLGLTGVPIVTRPSSASSSGAGGESPEMASAAVCASLAPWQKLQRP